LKFFAILVRTLSLLFQAATHLDWINFFSSGVTDHALRLGPYMRIAIIKKISTWTQVVACELANHNHQTQNTTTEGQDADPPARFASYHHKTAKQTAKGARPNKNNHRRFAKNTTQKHAANELIATQ